MTPRTIPQRLLACGLGVALSSIPVVAAAQPGAPTPAAAPEKADYFIAVGAGAGLGDPGWGTELSLMEEVSARVQPLRWLGAGASFFNLNAINNEGPALKVRALELNAEAHPFHLKWIDPFVRVGVVAVVQASGGYGTAREDMSRFGLDSMAGISALLGPFAVGVHVRYGFTNKAWTMLGAHVEARF